MNNTTEQLTKIQEHLKEANILLMEFLLDETRNPTYKSTFVEELHEVSKQLTKLKDKF